MDSAQSKSKLNEPPPLVGMTNDERRMLKRVFVFVYIAFFILHLIFCVVIFVFDTREDRQSFYRESSYWNSSQPSWPSSTPRSEVWPDAVRIAHYRSNSSLISSVYASANDKGFYYSMDVFQINLPFTAIETKKTLTKRGVVLTSRNPPKHQDPSMTFKPLGIILNPGIYTLVVWSLICYLPIQVLVFERRSDYRRWMKRTLCPICKYDIQDLPICPECGTPA